MDYDSIVNQDIKQKLVSREVIHCASTMMYNIRECIEFQQETDELFGVPDYYSALEVYLYELDEEETQGLLDNYDVESIEDLDPEEVCSDLNLEYDYADIFEYWIVTNWLGEKLKKHGESVAEFLGFTIWGRQTSGQAILLDDVISRIAYDMGILEGQERDWSKR